GLVLLFVGGYVLAMSLDGATRGIDMALGLFIGGVAIGLVAGQLPNMILSGVGQDEASEASGLQGTAQNLGMALGTAVIGTVILSVALSSLVNQVEASPIIPDEVSDEISEVIQRPLNEADADQLDADLAALPQEQQDELKKIYATGTLRGFQGAIIVGGIVALFGALLAIRLPKKKLDSDSSVETTIEQVVRNPTLPGLQLEMDDLSSGPEH
ncbi:MAG: hypothetical protein DRJ28_08075, partial [Actinobacteria bacterium]